MISKQIFRKYDIRGIVDKDLTDEAVGLIAHSFAKKIKNKFNKDYNKVTVTIGRDARVSSERFAKILSENLTEKGVNVIDIGMCPTPLLYFSLFELKNIDGGLMITGSHNPPEYNGLKVCIGKDTLFDEEIMELYNIIINDNKLKEKDKNKGNYEKYDICSHYINFMENHFKEIKLEDNKDKTIVLDSGNGVAGLVAPEIFKRLNFNVIDLFSEPDGTFPNHHPDPTIVENLKFLKEEVLKNHAIVGVGYDGDADRIGAITEKGDIIWGDQLLILYSRDILEQRKNAKIIGDVKCSQVLFDDIKENGGIPIMWKTGHSFIKNKLKEEKAAVAGEMSGHIFFADRYYGFDDAIYASLRLIELIVKSGKKLTELLSDIPETYVTEEIRIDCPEDKKFKIPDILKEKVLNDEELREEIKDIITIDGIRIIFKEGWGLVRASNTQPVLVLRFEGYTPEKRDFYRSKIEKMLEIVINSEE